MLLLRFGLVMHLLYLISDGFYSSPVLQYLTASILPVYCRTDLKAMAENGHTENGAAAAEKRKAEDDTENGGNGANGAKREKVIDLLLLMRA